jgi:cobalt-zinc-cadmium efflux system outer membrane protein
MTTQAVRAAWRAFAVAAPVLLIFTSGCALTPRGLRAERASLQAAAAEFRRGPAPADLPVQRDGNDWRTLLRRALLANGDVRAAWFDWKAAVERVSGASAWPNTNIALGYSYLFSDENMKTFDRMSFSAGFDAMENLSYPGKAMAAGRVALADARAAGERFRAAKFSVQRRVIDAWLDLALAAEKARIAAGTAALAGIGADVADASLRGGGDQAEALGARITAARADNAGANALADIEAARATLAALTATASPDAILTPTRLPHARELPPDRDVLVEAAVRGPAVRGLEADRRARKEEEDLARLQWVPDINPYAMVTGSIEQGVGAVIVLPSAIAEIRSGIKVAKAMRGAAASRLMQARRDQRGEVAAALATARNAERARRLLEDRVLVAAEAASTTAASSYSGGGATLAELLETRSLLLETRTEIAEAAIEREKQLAALEEALGADLETFTSRKGTALAGSDTREEEL